MISILLMFPMLLTTQLLYIQRQNQGDFRPNEGWEDGLITFAVENICQMIAKWYASQMLIIKNWL